MPPELSEITDAQNEQERELEEDVRSIEQRLADVIDDDELLGLIEKLRLPSTVRIEHELFTIQRGGDNRFHLEFRESRRAA